MSVSGWGYAPSDGGQQILLWVGYPDDYCGADGCHGFYANPWVNSDGTFSVTFSDALEQPGTGKVSLIAYLPKPDKWSTVASESYVVR